MQKELAPHTVSISAVSNQNMQSVWHVANRALC